MSSEALPYRIEAYEAFLNPETLALARSGMVPVESVPGLEIQAGLREDFPDIETSEALRFACRLFELVHDDLRQLLEQRRHDRALLDAATQRCHEENTRAGTAFSDPDYRTVIGLEDADGRLLIGPQSKDSEAAQALARVQKPVEVPDFLEGPQVTLFGPPGSAKMSINAMNTLHRRLPNEDPLVAELVDASTQRIKWGADNEDSKTPIMRDFLSACRNLTGCFEGTLQLIDDQSGKAYKLAEARLSQPIKRFPGLAIPDGNHLYHGSPLPLHLYDFALHLFHNHHNNRALVFYVPKLETEAEAAYLHKLIKKAESLVREINPDYEFGSVRLYIVFENPRAIFRIRAIAHELHPYFVGGSLGWHDFLASTARLFRHDPHYRIPVKADPNIVINNIRESHRILERELGPIGAIKLGGMYGVLYEDGNAKSFEVSMVGYIKDVITQLKRKLDGFWVAHPSFVRIGVAIVEAWQRREQDADDDSLTRLIEALVEDPLEREQLHAFLADDDVPGLNREDPRYLRSVLAADLQESPLISNSDPEEVRYNLFQALQYLCDWLCGNGCVALPATLTNAHGEQIFVRIMDDLATTERSRWEVWAELKHGRVSLDTFERLLAEEIDFIQQGKETDTKKVQVPWSGEAERWYPIAIQLLRRLVLDPEPVEFVTELCLPFTLEAIRNAEDPWKLACELDEAKYLRT